MIVIKEFYTHKEKKSYKIGDFYNGEKFNEWEKYLKEDVETKVEIVKPKSKNKK